MNSPQPSIVACVKQWWQSQTEPSRDRQWRHYDPLTGFAVHLGTHADVQSWLDEPFQL